MYTYLTIVFLDREICVVVDVVVVVVAIVGVGVGVDMVVRCLYLSIDRGSCVSNDDSRSSSVVIC